MSSEPGTFSSLIGRTWRENQLFSVLVELTYRCNLDCFFCYNDLGLKGAPLTTPEYMRFFEDLAQMQVLNLTLSGGEPLAHPDFLKLGGHARKLGFVVRIKSNGHALSGQMLSRIKTEIDPYQVEVSLHGAQAETHDRQTRVPGSFARLMANLAEMEAIGLRIKLNSTLTRWNEDEAEGMFAIADRFGFELQFDPDVTPRDDGDLSPLTIRPSREGVSQLFRLEYVRSGAAANGSREDVPAPKPRAKEELVPPPPGKHCGAGSSGITVDPYGNVYPCVQWRRGVGNLHERPIQEIWNGSPELQRVRQLTTEAAKVVAQYGPQGPLLAFCPGVAASITGSPLSVYPSARQRAEIIEQVKSEFRPVSLPNASGA